MIQNPTIPPSSVSWGRYLLFFFVAAWMFVLGVLVGRGSAPVTFDIEALEKELIALRQNAVQEKQEAVEKAVRGEYEETPLTFYEVLKSDELEIDAMPPREGALSPLSRPPHKTRALIMKKTAGQASVSLAPVNPIPETQPPPSPQPAIAPPPSATADTGALTIQIAATKDADAAERIVANLKKEGYSAYLSRVVIPEQGLWFRIRVGSYQTREQAARDIARLAQSKRKPILVAK